MRTFLALLLLTLPPLARAGDSPPLPNADFEQQLTGWSNPFKMGSTSTDSAHGGKLGLHVEDADPEKGSAIDSATLPVEPGQTYQLNFWARNLSGKGLGVYLKFSDASGQPVATPPDHSMLELPVDSDWKMYVICCTAPPDAARCHVFIHSYTNALVTADLDDFALSAVK